MYQPFENLSRNKKITFQSEYLQKYGHLAVLAAILDAILNFINFHQVDFGRFWICQSTHLKEHFKAKTFFVAICFRSYHISPGLCMVPSLKHYYISGITNLYRTVL